MTQSTSGQELQTVAFQFWETNPAQPTSSEAWQNGLSKTALPVAVGIYRITWSFELRVVLNGALNSGAVARFRLNGSRKGDAYYRPAARTGETETEWCGFPGWDRIVFAEGDTPLLEIDWRRDPVEGGNDSIEIRKLKMGIEFMG